MADRLRDVRLRAGLSGKQLSQLSGWQPSKVSRMETGRQLPTEPDVIRWSELCGADDAGRAELLALRSAATTAHRTWQHRVRHGVRSVQAEYNRLVRQATAVRHFETAWVPGLLQTPAYARAVFTEMVSLHQVSLDDVDGAVAARLERQRYLYDPTKRFEFLIAEPVLRWRLCASDVLLQQLDRLRGAVDLPNVRFGILPLDKPLATPPQNAFQLYDETAIVETFFDETTHSAPESAAYARVLDRLWADAATGREATQLVDRAAAALRNTRSPTSEKPATA